MSEDARHDAGERIDKWLWAARFYKTRSLATQAVNGGLVHVDDARVKPSRAVRAGTRVTVHKNELSWEVTVLALSLQRGPASQAVLLYEESEASRSRREREIARRREAQETRDRNAGRPTKRERRELTRLKGR